MPLIKTPTTIIDHQSTGRTVRAARKAAGLSLRAVGSRVGLSAPYLSDLEQGRRNWNDELYKRVIVALKQPKILPVLGTDSIIDGRKVKP
jgi:predicted transcriptional regulator